MLSESNGTFKVMQVYHGILSHVDRIIYGTPLAVERITWDTVRYLLYHIRHIKVLTYITMDVCRR